MPVEIRVAPEFSRRVKRSRLRAAALGALRSGEIKDEPTATILITDDKTIRELNRRFHQVNMPTDVLSFGSDEEGYLGDIVISYETATENARRAGWHIPDELDLLVVHGMLHLLGYDDSEPRLRAEMWQKQAQILGPIPEIMYAEGPRTQNHHKNSRTD